MQTWTCDPGGTPPLHQRSWHSGALSSPRGSTSGEPASKALPSSPETCNLRRPPSASATLPCWQACNTSDVAISTPLQEKHECQTKPSQHGRFPSSTGKHGVAALAARLRYEAAGAHKVARVFWWLLLTFTQPREHDFIKLP